jgi:broad specificity phosphatase PhoE
MFLIMITHAEPKDVVPWGSYRGLTDTGRKQVKLAAAEFRKALQNIIPTLDGKNQAIAKIISSQMARCLETVMLFADELQPLTKTSEIEINNHLRDLPNRSLKSSDLVAAC